MVLVDDVGSFPLPPGVTREAFAAAWGEAHRIAAEGGDLSEGSLRDSFYQPVATSLTLKVRSGLDIVSYPQHYQMHHQFLDPIERYPEEPYLIQKRYAVIPELEVVKREAEKLSSEREAPLRVKACVTGPLELYLQTGFGFNVYEEVLLNLARSVNRFLRNAEMRTPHAETAVLSVDEPSLGFVDLLNIDSDGLVGALEEAVRGLKAEVQIHLHTLKASGIPLRAEGIQVLTSEFAASPENLDYLRRQELERHGKFLRAGVTRTNIDTIIGEGLEEGRRLEGRDLVDSREAIRGRYEKVLELFGDRIAYAGPDCGLGSWPSQEVAYELLRRTVEGVRGF
jgi:5-methyltetrahydropteroyltriglutamate--homocysteine methyltransferase